MKSDPDALIADAMAALELKLRHDGMPVFHDTRMAVVHAGLRLVGIDVEVMLAYFLDAKQRLLAVEEVAVGAPGEVTFSPRRLAKMAALHDADSVLVIHNHPEDPRPSEQDKLAIESIDRALVGMGVLAQHFVVSPTGYSDIRNCETTYFKDLPRATDTTDAKRCPYCHATLTEDES